jgi:4-aminobutyrate aminotransferase
MLSRIRELLGPYEQVGDIRGLGFMQGIEFVEDARTKRRAPELRDRIVKNCVFKQQLWVLGAGRSSIRILPPLTMTEEEAMEGIDRLARAVHEEIRATQQLHETAAILP